MGFFNKKASTEIIQGEIVKSIESNSIPEWCPVVTYTHGELSNYGNFYTKAVQDSNDINKIMKSSDNKSLFFKHNKSFRTLRLRYASEDNPTYNMIVERIAYGTVFSDITAKNDEKIDFAAQDDFSLQAILICGTCLTIPLFPNEIVGFRTENKSLKFICEQCADDTGKKHYSIEQLLENDLETLKNVKIVKNMKEFKPTILLTDFDDKPRPTVTHVEKIERDTINAGEENDLRTVKESEAENLAEGKTNPHLELTLPPLLENDQRKRNGAEFDKVLEELNTFENPLTVDGVFKNEFGEDSSKEKTSNLTV